MLIAYEEAVKAYSTLDTTVNNTHAMLRDAFNTL